MAELIGQDPVIAAQVLQVANSALYAAVVPVESLLPAILRLGLEQARMPAYAVAAARDHHDVPLPLTPETLELHLIRVADGLCEEIGVAPFSTGAMGPAGEESLEALGIEAERRAYFELQFRGLAEQLEGLLQAA